MSIKEMSRVWEFSKTSGAGLLTMLALADRANDDGVCWPGYAELARKARISKRQVANILKACEDTKELGRAQREGQRSTLYAILVGCDDKEIVRRIAAANEMPHILNPISLPSELDFTTPSEIAIAHDPSIEPSKKQQEARRNIFTVYESNIGMIGPTLRDELVAIESEYPEGWFEDAVKEAVLNNVRKMSYIKAILSDWKVKGRGNGKSAIVDRKPAFERIGND